MREEMGAFFRHSRFSNLLHSEPNIHPSMINGEDDFAERVSAASAASPAYYFDRSPMSGDSSPYNMSPWTQASPFMKSPWSSLGPPLMPFSDDSGTFSTATGLIGSLVREEGHIYSLAASGDLLYTGSDSKNIRVWKNQTEFSAFKSTSGLVKVIILAGDRIFTGHQDGKIRVWRVSGKNPRVHKRIGTMPTFKHLLRSSMNPSNYVEVRRHRNALWIRHGDAVSSLSLNEDQGLLYSGSWDKTFKVWRIADGKFSHGGVLRGHKMAVLCLAAAGSLVFSGSADKTICVWRREEGVHICLSVLSGHTGPVKCLAVERDGGGPFMGNLRCIVYSGSLDKSVKVWRVSDVVPPEYNIFQASPRVQIFVPDDSASGSSKSRYWVAWTSKIGRIALPERKFSAATSSAWRCYRSERMVIDMRNRRRRFQEKGTWPSGDSAVRRSFISCDLRWLLLNGGLGDAVVL